MSKSHIDILNKLLQREGEKHNSRCKPPIRLYKRGKLQWLIHHGNIMSNAGDIVHTSLDSLLAIIDVRG